MNNERATELLHEELDGGLDAASAAELAGLLKAEPALAREREQLQDLQRTLAEVSGAEQPPAGFAARIARRIDLPRPPTLQERIATLFRRPLLVPAMTFAMGLVIAVALYPALRDTTGLDTTQMSGTLVQQQTRAGLSPDARLALALDAVQGEVTLAAGGPAAALLEFDLQTQEPVEVVIDLAGSGLDYAALPKPAAGTEMLGQLGPQMRLRRTQAGYFAVPLGGTPKAGGSVLVEFRANDQALTAGVLAIP